MFGDDDTLTEDTGFSRKIGLLRTFISLRFENCDSMEDYVNKVVDTAQKLQRTGFDISEEWIGAILLAGLPVEKFGPMIMAIEHSWVKITTDNIKNKLLDLNLADKAGSAFASRFLRNDRSYNFERNSVGGSKNNLNVKNSEVRERNSLLKCYGC